jgi:hypothetical protein
MIKITSAKRNSAIFLAILLVLGTIATIIPSAQAQPYYEEEYYQEYPLYNGNNDYKSKDSNVILNKIKCNNINDNLNNVDVNSGLPNGNDALAEIQAADEGLATTTANGRGDGERNGNDFRFVCINNNDNENNVVVVNETTPIPPTPPDTITCEECFTENENLTPVQLEAINSLLGNLNPTVTFFETQISLNDLAALCTLLTLSSNEENLRNSVFELIAQTNAFFLDPSEIIEESVADEIVQCILEALANEV